MFRTARNILTAGVAIAFAAAPSIALADTPHSSGSARTIREITITKTVNVPTPKLLQASHRKEHPAG